MDEAGDNEAEETLDGEFELETSEEDGFTEESPEKRVFQSVLNLGGKELKSEGKATLEDFLCCYVPERDTRESICLPLLC